MPDDAPNRKFIISVYVNGAIIRIRRLKPRPIRFEFDTLDGKLAVHITNSDTPVVKFYGFIDDKQIAVVDAVAGHAVARHAHEKGRCGIAYQFLVEIERRIEKIIRRRGETGFDRTPRNGKSLRHSPLGTMKGQIGFVIAH